MRRVVRFLKNAKNAAVGALMVPIVIACFVLMAAAQRKPLGTFIAQFLAPTL